ncbi:hypothetical protein HK100_002479 [Physocladia obscura]|uniref:CLASP N-terminal domain-containing protein n=1 Tax=Physocladia obscura TaxID=109957 RepID=A0AAD5T8Q4_9FUNG|nr:hypothetical protein HK100_002479 [Physocladia obscura]
MQGHPIRLDSNGVEAETNVLLAVFAQKESEDTWVQMDDGLTRYMAVIKGSCQQPNFILVVKKLKQPIILALSTERTRLSRTAMLFCEVLGQSLEEKFESLADFILPALLRLCTRANKIIVTCAVNALKVIIDSAGVPSLVTLLMDGICAPSPSKTLRIAAAECLNRLMGVNSVAKLEKYVEAIEACIKNGTVDSTPEVRGLIKSLFELYKEMFPYRLERFVTSLPDVAAKYLKVGKHLPASSAVPGGVSKTLPLRRGPPTFTNNAGPSGPSRAPIVRTASVTPDTGSRDDDIGSLDSDTQSFVIEHVEQRARHGSELPKAQRLPIGETGLPARRLLVERPSNNSLHNGSSAILTEHIGGAQRVPREIKNIPSSSTLENRPTLSKAKALRVPMVQTAESLQKVNEEQLNASQISGLRSTASSNLKRPSISRASTQTRPPSATSKPIEIFDFVQLSNRLKNSDWTVRLAGLEYLTSYISTLSASVIPTMASEIRLKSTKFCDAYILGISDNQTKCINAALEGLLALLESAYSVPEIIDSIVPRVAGVSFYQQTKSRSITIDLGRRVLACIVDRFGIEMEALACIHAVNNPGFAKILKIRAGCLAILSEISEDEWKIVLSRPSNMKIFTSRIFLQAADTDAAIQKSVKLCIASLQAVGGDAFWTAWAATKPAEKKAVNTLFQTSDISLARTDLDAIRRSNLSITIAANIAVNDPAAHDSINSTNPAKSTRRRSSQLPRYVSSPGIVDRPSEAESPKNIYVAPVVEKKSRASIDSWESIAEEDSSSIETADPDLKNDVSLADDVEEHTEKLDTIHDGDINEYDHTNEPANDETSSQSEGDNKYAENSSNFIEEPVAKYEDEKKELIETIVEKSIEIADQQQNKILDSQSTDSSPTSNKNLFQNELSKFLDTKTVFPPSHTPSLKSEKVRNLPTVGSGLPSSKKKQDSEIATTPKKENRVEQTVDEFATPRPTLKKSTSISFGDITVIPDRINSIPHTPSPASLDTSFREAMEAGLAALWEFSQQKRNFGILEDRLEQVIDFIMAEINGDANMPAAATKAGLKLLHALVENFAVDGRATDVLTAALHFEGSVIDGDTDALEIEYELNSLLSTFKQTFEAKTLLSCVVHILEVGPEFIKRRHCFELATSALMEAKRIEGNGDDDILFSGDEVSEGCYWDRIIRFIVDGLDHKQSATRKAAFDLTVAICERKGDDVSHKVYAEVEKRSGLTKKMIVQGMVDKKLA